MRCTDFALSGGHHTRPRPFAADLRREESPRNDPVPRTRTACRSPEPFCHARNGPEQDSRENSIPLAGKCKLMMFDGNTVDEVRASGQPGGPRSTRLCRGCCYPADVRQNGWPWQPRMRPTSGCPYIRISSMITCFSVSKSSPRRWAGECRRVRRCLRKIFRQTRHVVEKCLPPKSERCLAPTRSKSRLTATASRWCTLEGHVFEEVRNAGQLG